MVLMTSSASGRSRNRQAANAGAQLAAKKKAERVRRSQQVAERRVTSDRVRDSEPAPTAYGRGVRDDSPPRDEFPDDFRAGFACFVGRPNAGKSTLTNALVGAKVAITSGRPQTTRHTVRGIVHRPDAQLVLVDTPGLHRPRTLLGERLNDQVRATWAEVDVIGFCIPADQKIGPGDTYIAAGARRGAAHAEDRHRHQDRRGDPADRRRAAAGGGRARPRGRHRVGRGGPGVGGRATSRSSCWRTCWSQQLPESPPLYPGGELTDEPEEVMVAELIREAALEGVRDELPHSLAVTVEEMALREGRPADRRCWTCTRSCTWSGPARRRS